METGLDRFVRAQADTYDQALAELRAGAKRSHWMWYVFPQIAGLGHSDMALHYAIRDLAEARAYLAHPRPRPAPTAVEALLAHRGTSAEAIMGAVDAMKLRSSLTLFANAGGDPRIAAALEPSSTVRTPRRSRGSSPSCAARLPARARW
ncbi:DUF1810 domain-containing protein [Sphingomonas sp. MMS24-JH45]